MASEEAPDIIQIPDGFRCGKYCLLFDPLDGSSNIDVNVPVGTIFSVLRKITRGNRGQLEDMLQPGRRQPGRRTDQARRVERGRLLDQRLLDRISHHDRFLAPVRARLDAGRHHGPFDAYHACRAAVDISRASPCGGFASHLRPR